MLECWIDNPGVNLMVLVGDVVLAPSLATHHTLYTHHLGTHHPHPKAVLSLKVFLVLTVVGKVTRAQLAPSGSPNTPICVMCPTLAHPLRTSKALNLS